MYIYLLVSNRQRENHYQRGLALSYGFVSSMDPIDSIETYQLDNIQLTNPALQFVRSQQKQQSVTYKYKFLIKLDKLCICSSQKFQL